MNLFSHSAIVSSPHGSTIILSLYQTSSSSSSSSLFVQIKIHDANKEHMIKPEQDSKMEKTILTAALE